MGNITDYLKQILSARYGKDVRQAIHDGIQQCYYDGKAGEIDLQARQDIETLGERVTNETSQREADIDALSESLGNVSSNVATINTYIGEGRLQTDSSEIVVTNKAASEWRALKASDFLFPDGTSVNESLEDVKTNALYNRISVTNIDAIPTKFSVHSTSASTEGTFPDGFSKVGVMLPIRRTSSVIIQLYIDTDNRMATRVLSGSTWGEWDIKVSNSDLAKNRLETSVDLTPYNSTSNRYTFPSDGYITTYCFEEGSGTIGITGADRKNMLYLGGRGFSYNNPYYNSLFVKSGMEVYCDSFSGGMGAVYCPLT